MKSSLALIALLFPLALFAQGTRGGGNPEEIDFHYKAKEIQTFLKNNSARVSTLLANQQSKLIEAIDKTPVRCADQISLLNGTDHLILSDRKIEGPTAIVLNCDLYFSYLQSGSPEFAKGTILQAYAELIEEKDVEAEKLKLSNRSYRLFFNLLSDQERAPFPCTINIDKESFRNSEHARIITQLLSEKGYHVIQRSYQDFWRIPMIAQNALWVRVRDTQSHADWTKHHYGLTLIKNIDSTCHHEEDSDNCQFIDSHVVDIESIDEAPQLAAKSNQQISVAIRQFVENIVPRCGK